VILFLHNRYRNAGGEERVVADLMWLVRERLGEDAELLERDSAVLERREAAVSLLRGGLRAEDVTRAVRLTRARIVHAHNLTPGFGWRALAAARAAGARVVMHLHQYRLVCAVGVCFTHGEQCTRCHGRNTLPGVARNCRGSVAEALLYAAGLSLWQRRTLDQVDTFIVPSEFARGQLGELGLALGDARVVPHVIREFAPEARAPRDGTALLATRLVPEKGVEVAIEACRIASVPLLIAGDGPARSSLEASARGDVRFLGQLDQHALARIRARASLALAPSLSAESFGLAAAEAMAAGLPVAGSRIGALAELLPGDWLAPPGDALALAAAIRRLVLDDKADARAIERIKGIAAPEVVAPLLAEVYR
jgi:glycosyltransferase involved in cell wall biosynthesis